MSWRHKWMRQLAVGVRSSLRIKRPLKPVDLKRLKAENRKLKEVVLNQALVISDRFQGTYPPNINEGTHLISVKGPTQYQVVPLVF